MSHPFFDSASEDGTVRAKICGVTNATDAAWIVDCGGDALGVNFWPESKRYIHPEAAAPWLRDLEGSLTRIGVFVNPTVEEVRSPLDAGILDAAQLHGDETTEFCQSLIDSGYRIIKALGLKDLEMLATVGHYPGKWLLLDAYAPEVHGGTGRTLDWTLGRRAVDSFPDRHILLAGGLTPENVGGAISAVRPWGADVASGVESSPGHKDPQKVAAFIQQCHASGNRTTAVGK